MSPVSDAPSLRHVIVVGGTVDEWRAMSAEQWQARLDELGKVADHVGASWLTLRPYEGDGRADDLTRTVGSCLVAARGSADGRGRVAEAAAALVGAGAEVTESALARELNLPAAADPDLVVVLGEARHLPASVVWELAYAELVFIPVSWQQLGASHLDDAIAAFARRHRRFGGLDD